MVGESLVPATRAQAIEDGARQVNQSLGAFSMRVYHEERAHPDWNLTQVIAELITAK